VLLAKQRAAVAFPGLEPGRGVPAAVQGLLQRPDVEHPVLDEHVVRLAGVVLQLVVAPTADPLVGVIVVEPVSDVEIPFRLVNVLSVELVAPGQLPPGRRWLAGLVGAARSGRARDADSQSDQTPAIDSHNSFLLVPKGPSQLPGRTK